MAANDTDRTLLAAAGKGALAGVKGALAQGADINARDEFDSTPLILASRDGHLDVVEYLLSLKPDIGAIGEGQMTALHLAARDGRTEIVQRLLASGAFDSQRLLNDALTVARMSVNGNPSIVRMIETHKLQLVAPAVSKGDASAQLIVAAERGDLAGVRSALDQGADVKVRDGGGTDALNWASLRGHATVVKLLIENGAPFNALNSVGWPPLGQAAGQGRLEAARELIKGGANVNIAFAGGKTPLICAAHQSYADLVRLLLEIGADKTARTEEDEDGRNLTARELAAMQGHYDIVAML